MQTAEGRVVAVLRRCHPLGRLIQLVVRVQPGSTAGYLALVLDLLDALLRRSLLGALLARTALRVDLRRTLLLDRIQQLETDHQRSEYLSTHPSHATRIVQLQAWMPEALALYHPTTEDPSPELPKLSVTE